MMAFFLSKTFLLYVLKSFSLQCPAFTVSEKCKKRHARLLYVKQFSIRCYLLCSIQELSYRISAALLHFGVPVQKHIWFVVDRKVTKVWFSHFISHVVDSMTEPIIVISRTTHMNPSPGGMFAMVSFIIFSRRGPYSSCGLSTMTSRIKQTEAVQTLFAV